MNTNVKVGMGPLSFLWMGIILLKIAHVIHWSWWLVIFFPLIIGTGLAAIALVIACIWTLVEWCQEADANARAAKKVNG